MTRDEITRMAREAGFVGLDGSHGALRRFAALVAAAEREECAKVCDQRKIITPEWQHDQFYNQCATHCAAAIRARGEKGQS
jgi:hypothetical protein